MLCQPKEQSDINFFFLSKKTRRGRKSNFQLPEGPRCTICLEFEEFSSEPIEKCSQCNSLFHFSCYESLLTSSISNKTTMRSIKESNFVCCKCDFANNQKRSIESIKCGICNMSYGILEQQDSNSGLFYHLFCKRLIPELVEEPMDNLRKWRYKNSCHFCKAKLSKDLPVIKCLNSKCKEFYHIPCAIEKGMLFSIGFQALFYNKKNEESIPFYCSCHNKRLVTCYKEHMYECNRKSTRYSSDSHNDNESQNDNENDNDNDNEIEETEKKIKEDFSSYYPKELIIDFAVNNPIKDDDYQSLENNNECPFANNYDFHHYFPNEPNEKYCIENNDKFLPYFELDLFKEEKNNNHFFIN